MRKTILLSLLAAFLALPSVARDFAYEYEGQTITYTVIDEEAKTVETKAGPDTVDSSLPGNDVSGDLVLPSHPKDGDVEYTLTRIGYRSFYGCSELTDINLPESVTVINGSAFYGCSGLTDINLPESVTVISSYAFYGCSGLTAINIPNSVNGIGISAFENCSALTEVIIPPYTGVFGGTFDGCTGLWKVAYPDYRDNLFFPSGTCIAYPYRAIFEDGVIYSPDKTEILYASLNLKGEYVVPESVTKIGDYAFIYCDGLTKVTLPNSLTEIGDYAFERCRGLTSVDIPNSVIKIGESAFENCDGLTSVDIPNSVTEIGKSAFRSCDGLTQVTIPNSVTEISRAAFEGCDGLTQVTIPNSVISIGYTAFQSCHSLTSVDIPNSVTEIGASAFQNCSGLTQVTIPNSVTDIGAGAFKYCTNITEVNYVTDDPKNIYNNYRNPIFSDETCSTATLYVKAEALEKIKECSPWRYFDNIEVKDFTTGVDEIVNNSAIGMDINAPVEIYTLDGKQVSSSIDNLTSGVYIVRQGKLAKKIAVK